ncbi:MAG: NAD(P)/FAD-dependent oxidoreductase, partial [Candidatus Promineifilaceae bacterium]
SSADVVIIGGGVMGASTAYHLAKKAPLDIVLLEREPFFGMGATGKCAGGVRYQFSTEINIRLSQLSLPMLDRFEDEIGRAIDFRKCGYLFLLTTDEDVQKFRANVRLQRHLGVRTQWLEPDDIHRLAPLLDCEDVIAGTFYDQDGLVDPNSVVDGYVAASRRLGVIALNDAAVTGIEVRNGRIKGAVVGDQLIECDVVVNAAGPWSAMISGMAGVQLPVLPVMRQMLTTTPIAELPIDFPFVVDFAQSLYYHREGDGLLTGMSNPNQPPGYDEAVDDDWELIHMEAAIKRLPVLAHASRVSAWAGLYEVTPDAHPIIGAVSDIDGMFVVSGFSGHGFMHGPAAGLLLAEQIVEGQASTIDISMLDLDRFREGREILEYNVI